MARLIIYAVLIVLILAGIFGSRCAVAQPTDKQAPSWEESFAHDKVARLAELDITITDRVASLEAVRGYVPTDVFQSRRNQVELLRGLRQCVAVAPDRRAMVKCK